MDKQTVQMLVTKLDTNAVTLKEAKEFAKRFGLPTEGQTKEQFIRQLTRAVRSE
jgi:hypothetical protein